MNAFYGFFATIMSFILSPFVILCNGNYAIAIFLFTFIINVVFLPVNMKQQRASAQQARLRHKLEKIKEECGNDRQKFQEEQAKLMQESGTSMLSGCLPMFIRLPFFIGIYTAIQKPLTYIVKLSSDTITKATEQLSTLKIGFAQNYEESAIISNYKNLSVSGLEKIDNYNFDFFGIDLTLKPEFTLDFSSLTKDDLLLWIIPLLSFLTSLLSMYISTKLQKHSNPEMNSNMGCMLIFMPLFSLWIAFSVPGAVGFYWACSNLVTTLIQTAMQLFYTPAMINAKAEATEMKKRRAYEQARINEAQTKQQ